jgi:hypothetical protein
LLGIDEFQHVSILGSRQPSPGCQRKKSRKFNENAARQMPFRAKVPAPPPSTKSPAGAQPAPPCLHDFIAAT